MHRILRVLTLLLASLAIGMAAVLLRPADVVEFLAGLALGSLGAIQWVLLAMGVAFLAVNAALSRSSSRAQRAVRVALLLLAAVTGGGLVMRDHLPYDRDVVRFPVSDVAFEGTLYRPRTRSATRRPALLVLHGSGPMARHAYHFAARRFAERGFVVLNVDKRGVGGSGGTYHGDDLGAGVIEQRAVDARAALAFLAQRTDVDTSRLGVFAISQGGWITPLLLSSDTPARFAVNFSGAAVSSSEEGRWSDWAGEEGDHFGLRPPPVPLEELDRRMADVPPGGFDPRTSLRGMRWPSLWLHGEWDASLPTMASVRVLDSVRVAGVPVTVRVFPEANHALMIVRGPNGSRLASFAPGVWDTVFAWLERQGVQRSTNE